MAFLLGLFLISISLLASGATSDKGRSQDEKNYWVDQAALASQEKAIQKLNELLRKYRNTAQEPVFIFKLTELQIQKSLILFRAGHHKKNSAAMNQYKKSLENTVVGLSTLIQKFPDFQEIPKATFQRGRVHEELGNKTLAIKDYLTYTSENPDGEEASKAFMSLADYAISDNDHRKAITFLKNIEDKPEDPLLPFAFYKLGWSYYNLKNIPLALNYLERQIQHYNGKQKKDKEPLGAADSALKEKSIMDTAVFYFEGYEQKLSQYKISQALPYFKRLDAGPVYGKVVVRFAKLLRSHDHEKDLQEIMEEFAEKETKREDSLEVYTLVYEMRMNKRKYQSLDDLAKHLPKNLKHWKGFSNFPKAKQQVLDSATVLQELIVKTGVKEQSVLFTKTLASLYGIYMKIVDSDDPYLPQVHYNLAETLFAIKDYAGSSFHYRKIIEISGWNFIKGQTRINPFEASLKSISARYEILRSQGLIPQKLSPQKIGSGNSSKVDPMVSEWVAWIDLHRSKQKGDQGLEFENFIFESNRALYVRGNVSDTIQRFQDFIIKHPKSKLSVPSASLVLDTYIISEDWEMTGQIAEKFMKLEHWKSGPFHVNLKTVASDAYFKTIEGAFKNKDYKTTGSKIQDFIKKYPDSPRTFDCLTMGGKAMLALGEKAEAEKFFSNLIQLPEKSQMTVPREHLSNAHIARAVLLEEKFQFLEASQDYLSYFKLLAAGGLKVEKINEGDLRKKILFLAWLAADPKRLRNFAKDSPLCKSSENKSEDIYTVCNKYLVLSHLGDEESLDDDAFEMARKGPKANRPLWSLLQLHRNRELGFRDRNLLVNQMISYWDEIEPTVALSILPQLLSAIPKTFSLNRLAISQVAPLRADEKYITRRVEVMREFENSTSKAIKLPWARIRATLLHQTAEVYLDFTKGLASIPKPKDLKESDFAVFEDAFRKIILPFEEKAQEMRAKAFEIVSKMAVEDETFTMIAEPFFRENPSQAKKWKSTEKVESPPPVDLVFLQKLDPLGQWSSQKPQAKTQGNIQSRLVSALEKKNWQQVGFFMQLAKDKNHLNGIQLGILRSICLMQAGARAEGIQELMEIRKDFDSENRLWLTTILLKFYMRSLNRQDTKKLAFEIAQEKISPKHLPVFMQAKRFVDTK